MEPIFITTAEASALTSISKQTLKEKRLNGELEIGVHWIRVGKRQVLFNKELLLHWVKTRYSDTAKAAHEDKVKQYLESL